MHLAGIIESSHTQEVLDIIKYLFSVENRKVSFIEYGNRFKNKETWSDYNTALMQIGTEILIIRIKRQDIDETLSIIPLDTLIVNDYKQWVFVSSIISRKYNNFLNKITVILNSDVIKLGNFTDVRKCRVLCYGFNSESGITTSSTGEPSISGQFLCYIRESLVSVSGIQVEPQEFVMNLENMPVNPYNILAAATFAVLHDIDLNKVNDSICSTIKQNLNVVTDYKT